MHQIKFKLYLQIENNLFQIDFPIKHQKEMVFYFQILKLLLFSSKGVSEMFLFLLQDKNQIKRVHNMYEESQESQPEKHEENQPLPQYIEVEGKQIYIGGLDYNALNQQKQKQRKSHKNLLLDLKTKIHTISSSVLEKHVKKEKENEKKQNLDELSIKIMSIFQEKKKIPLNTVVYYEFDLNKEGFGKKKPNKIQKRLGKAYNKPTFTYLANKFFKQFDQLLTENQEVSDSPLEEIVQEINDEDDIFGECQEKQQVRIEMGKKLDFGIQDDFLKTMKRQEPIETQKQEQTDKYFFMRRKKIKKDQQIDDGYGQCYAENGPSLKQMIQLKKEGIQLFGDAKQIQTKQKKGPNIHKEYQKIKRIIQKKSKN